MRLPLTSMLFYCYLFLFTSSAIADGPACSKLSGLWFGTYTYKNASDCRRTGACTHMLSAEVKQLSGNTYQVDLSPPVDRTGSISITCENGQISIPVNSGYQTHFTCEENQMCRVTYDDERLGAVANKIN